MFDFEKPKIEIAEISEDKTYGKFVVEPLERGYGTTLGNSLSKEESIILLKELPSVVPYPLSKGSTTNLPYVLSSEISAISIFGFSKSNTTKSLLLGFTMR